MERKIVDVDNGGFKVSVRSSCADHYLIRRKVNEVIEQNPGKNADEIQDLIGKMLKRNGIGDATVSVIKG